MDKNALALGSKDRCARCGSDKHDSVIRLEHTAAWWEGNICIARFVLCMYCWDLLVKEYNLKLIEAKRKSIHLIVAKED